MNIKRITCLSEIAGALEIAKEILEKKIIKKEKFVIACEESTYALLEVVFSEKKINFYSTFARKEKINQIYFEIKKKSSDDFLKSISTKNKAKKKYLSNKKINEYFIRNNNEMINLADRLYDFEILIEEIIEDLEIINYEQCEQPPCAIICNINELKCVKANQLFIFNIKKPLAIKNLSENYKKIVELDVKKLPISNLNSKNTISEIKRKKFFSSEIASITILGSEWFYTSKAIKAKQKNFINYSNMVAFYDGIIKETLINLLSLETIDERKVKLKEIKNHHLRKLITKEIESISNAYGTCSHINNNLKISFEHSTVFVEFEKNIFITRLKDFEKIIIITNDSADKCILQLHMAYQSIKSNHPNCKEHELLILLCKDCKIEKKKVNFSKKISEDIISAIEKIT